MRRRYSAKENSRTPCQDAPLKITAKTSPQLKQNRREPQLSPHKRSENYSQDHTTENHSEDHTIEDKSQEQTTDQQPIDNHKLWVSNCLTAASRKLPSSSPCSLWRFPVGSASTGVGGELDNKLEEGPLSFGVSFRLFVGALKRVTKTLSKNIEKCLQNGTPKGSQNR